MASRKRGLSNASDVYKELDEVLCPICMDHPHNAVLLICSSHDKRCRPYICDTSYRHSNCLDRFKKLTEENASESNQEPVLTGSLDPTVMADRAQTRRNSSIEIGLPQGESVVNPNSGDQEGRTGGTPDTGDDNMEKSEEVSKLRCPLCRGEVMGWRVVENARGYLDLKTRSCSLESCSFIGSYKELRRHARRVHPTVHPAEVDPTRQRTWRHLEDQREYNDIVSAVSSAMPGSAVVGDYVIDGGERLLGYRNRNGGGVDESQLLSTFFFVQMLGLPEHGGSLSRLLRRHRGRAAGFLSRQRYLWGENLWGHRNHEGGRAEADLNIRSDNGRPNSGRRRRLNPGESGEHRQ